MSKRTPDDVLTDLLVAGATALLAPRGGLVRRAGMKMLRETLDEIIAHEGEAKVSRVLEARRRVAHQDLDGPAADPLAEAKQAFDGADPRPPGGTPHRWCRDAASPGRCAHAVLWSPRNTREAPTERQAACGHRLSQPTEVAPDVRRCKHCERKLRWLDELWGAILR